MRTEEEIRERIRYLERLKEINRYCAEDAEKMLKVLKWALGEEVEE